MADEIDQIMRRERDLLTTAVRADRVRLEELLHPEFVEVGASGRRWAREDIIAALLASPDADDAHIHELTARPVAAGVVLVTYTTRRAATAVHRSSLWVLHDGEWVVRYHQATPAPVDDEDDRRTGGPTS